MEDIIELPFVDTSQQDWAIEFISKADGNSKLTLPSTITGKSLSEYIVGLANANGGCILVGVYSHEGYGSGFQSVSHNVVDDAKLRIQGVDVDIEPYNLRFQQVYLVKVAKTESIAFSDGSPFILKGGIPVLMSEKMMLNRLGLGVDSSLINMLSEQITKQSSKVDEQSKEISLLTDELQEKSKLKYQIPGLLIGALIGWLLSVFLNNLFGIS